VGGHWWVSGQDGQWLGSTGLVFESPVWSGYWVRMGAN